MKHFLQLTCDFTLRTEKVCLELGDFVGDLAVSLGESGVLAEEEGVLDLLSVDKVSSHLSLPRWKS